MRACGGSISDGSFDAAALMGVPGGAQTGTQTGALPVRLDKWLWAARFFKTRALSQEAIDLGQVLVNDDRVKPARTVRLGDLVQVRVGDLVRTVVVCGLSDQRGPAPVAQTLYEETSESVRQRELRAEWRRVNPEPAHSIRGGRPTKRDRRDLARLGGPTEQ